MMHEADDNAAPSVADLIRQRPGMYIGGTDALAAAHLVAMAVEILAQLVANRSTDPPGFGYHAFLDVRLTAPDLTVLIDHHPDECSELMRRALGLQSQIDAGRMQASVVARQSAKDREPKVTSLTILEALTTDLGIFIFGETGLTTIVSIGHTAPPTVLEPMKGAAVVGHFRISELIRANNLSRDFLEGFLQGHRVFPGLMVRDVSTDPGS